MALTLFVASSSQAIELPLQHAAQWWQRLGDRFIVYGEWLYAKHTIYYDNLPHYFIEFDVFDLLEQRFMTTDERSALLAGLGFVSAPVLWRGTLRELSNLPALIGRSRYQTTSWREALVATLRRSNADETLGLTETDSNEQMEGLYCKVENESGVVERYKYVRASFLTTVVESGTHWNDRPIVPNRIGPNSSLPGSGV